ncbi:WecB/TagA/CpsF family glycosyltransferase [Deinococcus apachensis]|uniref:WecB/TagA/CpsF family glycosyltransferase n=1 Tax=Deinococcus apachensis TaxID=309886 RepID=UPI000475CA53|nr:WecB/TagA/CpsF family glycosyltransferase [Deinococcus apachensis]
MQQIKVLGVSVNTMRISDLHSVITKTVLNNSNTIIANHNLHSIALFHRDEELRRFYASVEYIHIDGMSLVKWGQLLGGSLREDHRVTYVDWIHPLMRFAAENGWRVYCVGGKPGVGEKAAEVLREEIPELQIWTHHGYFDTTTDSVENKQVVEEINTVAPHILLVGMGMPRQEKWIKANRAALKVHVVLPAGACMDYVAGAVPTPPRWMGRMGLEWLYRLYSEPKRLAGRYLVEPWTLVPLMARDLWQAKVVRRNGVAP